MKSEKNLTRGQFVADFIENNTEERVLPNGMRIIAVKTGMAPTVTVQVVYNVGAADEAPGERGLAHLLEHMIFKGTTFPDGTVRLSETDIVQIARQYGAMTNAFTSWDATSYFFSVNSSNWTPFLPLLADGMANARFDDQHLASEIKAVVQELRMGRDDHRRTALMSIISTAVPTNHPYHSPVIGYFEDLTTLTGARLKAFYKKYYCPSRATLVIVGDIDTAEALAHAEKAFSSLEKRAAVPTAAVEPRLEPTFLSPVVRVLPREIQKEELWFCWRIPGVKNHAESTIADAVTTILGGAESSRLAQRLVAAEQVAYGTYAMRLNTVLSDFLLIVITPVEGKGERCRAILSEEIQRIISQGVTDEELAIVRVKGVERMINALQAPMMYAGLLVNATLAGGSGSFYAERLRMTESVTSEQCQSFVQKYLRPDSFTMIDMVPFTDEQRALWKNELARTESAYQELLAAYSRKTPLEEPLFAKTMTPPVAVDITIPVPQETVTLSNKVTLMMTEHRALPLVAFSFGLRDGAFITNSAEAIANSVLTTMLTQRLSAAERVALHRPFESAGAQAYVSLTAGNLLCAPSDFRALIKHFVSVIKNPVWTEELFAFSRQKYLEELASMRNNLFQYGGVAIAGLLYGPSHPYGLTLEQYEVVARNLTLRDIEDFYKKYCVGEQFACSVVGDLGRDEMHSIIVETLGTLPTRGEYVARVPLKLREVYRKKSEGLDIHYASDQLYVSYAAPTDGDDLFENRVAAILATHICLAGMGSHLFQVREATGLFYTASGNFLHEFGNGDYWANVFGLINSDNADAFENALKGLFERFAASGVTETEVESARQRVTSLFDGILQNYLALANYQVHSVYLKGRPFSYPAQVIAAVRKVTAAEISAYLSNHVSFDTFSRLRIGNIPHGSHSPSQQVH